MQKGELTMEELSQANELLKRAVQTADCGITITPLDVSRMVVVGYGDSSFANADEMRTQIAMLVVVADRDYLQGESAGSIMSWASNRTKRVIRSTLAGESCAADSAADNAVYVAAFFRELHLRKSSTRCSQTIQLDEFPVFIATDCRSLFDAVQKVQPKVTEKRTLIDILSLKESIAEAGLKWVPARLQRSDCMTKLSATLMIDMLVIMSDTTVRLFSAEGLSAEASDKAKINTKEKDTSVMIPSIPPFY